MANGKRSLYAPTSGLAHALAAFGVNCQHGNRIGQGIGVAWRNREGGIRRKLGDDADCGADDG